MKSTSLLFASVLTLVCADFASAQTIRSFGWQSSPTTNFGSYYQAPWYYQQSHWIYNYMPYGYNYSPYGYGGYVLGQPPGVVHSPSLSSPYVASRDYGPPARSRSSMHPAIPYSELVAEDERDASEDRGYITIQVPTADTKVWIEGQLMTQQGLERNFMTPKLAVRGRTYTFEIRAEIPVKGFPNDPRRRTESIQIRAGQTKTLTLSAE